MKLTDINTIIINKMIRNIFENTENPSVELTREAFNERDSYLQLSVGEMNRRLRKIRHMISQNKIRYLEDCVQNVNYQDFNNSLTLEQLFYMGW